MNSKLINIDQALLYDYLSKKDTPVMEYDVIKAIIPAQPDKTEHHTLYVKHFSLYHALYKLKYSAGSEGYYLHMDCMRIRLVHIPEAGQCRHYNAAAGAFCGEPASVDYCPIHENQYDNSRNTLVFDYLHDFYTDPDNIGFGDSELLKKLLSGVRVYCTRKKEIEEALKFFELRNPVKKKIINRYRELAGKYHPDISGGSEEMMKKLNSSYMILKEVFVV